MPACTHDAVWVCVHVPHIYDALCEPSAEGSGAVPTHQVEDSVGVAGELGNLGERWVLPHQDLVLRVAMSAHLQAQMQVRDSQLLPGVTDPKNPRGWWWLWRCRAGLSDSLTSSLACLDQAKLQTWEPVSMHCSGCPVRVFQKRMQRSAVPPPEASSPCW